MKKNKYLAFLFAPIFFGFSACATVQKEEQKDTTYIFILHGTLENGRPIVSEFAVNKLISLASISNKDSFLCAFSKQAVILEEPNFTLSTNAAKYNFPDKKAQQDFLSQLSGKIEKLTQYSKRVGSRSFKEGSPITIDAVKVVASYWEINKTTAEQLNDYNHSFIIDKECYGKNFSYNIKDIVSVDKLTTAESAQIKNLLSLK